MKNKNKSLFTVLSLLLVTLTGASALAFPTIIPHGSIIYRTIKVDGDPSDWNGIQPLVTDPPSDANNPREDIKAVYAANDDENIYFLMELYSLDPVSVDVFEGFQGEYSFFIDIIPDVGHPDSGADYKIVHSIMETPDPGVSKLTELFFYNGSNWVLESGCTGVRGNSTIYLIEVGLPWECIGGPACFNCYFSAHFEPPPNQSDYAPDPSEGRVLLGCCPGYLPVGGILIPQSIVNHLIPAIILFASIILIMYSKNNAPHPLRARNRVT